MLKWLKNLFSSKQSSFQTAWNDLVIGDYVEVELKDPRSIGIMSDSSMTYQRLDAEDLQTLKVRGFLLGKRTVEPGKVEIMELNVVKSRQNRMQLKQYTILREEIKSMELVESK